jgi:hypothetical protein
MRVETFIETSLFSRQRDALLTDAEFATLTAQLADDPEAGTSLGGSLFKLRLALAGRGKRGGARVIYGWRRAPGVIVLLALYAKNAQADLTPAQLAALRAAFGADPP